MSRGAEPPGRGRRGAGRRGRQQGPNWLRSDRPGRTPRRALRFTGTGRRPPRHTRSVCDRPSRLPSSLGRLCGRQQVSRTACRADGGTSQNPAGVLETSAAEATRQLPSSRSHQPPERAPRLVKDRVDRVHLELGHSLLDQPLPARSSRSRRSAKPYSRTTGRRPSAVTPNVNARE